MRIDGLSSLSFDLSKDDDFRKALKSKNGRIDKKIVFKLPDIKDELKILHKIELSIEKLGKVVIESEKVTPADES